MFWAILLLIFGIILYIKGESDTDSLVHQLLGRSTGLNSKFWGLIIAIFALVLLTYLSISGQRCINEVVVDQIIHASTNKNSEFIDHNGKTYYTKAPLTVNKPVCVDHDMSDLWWIYPD